MSGTYIIIIYTVDILFFYFEQFCFIFFIIPVSYNTDVYNLRFNVVYWFNPYSAHVDQKIAFSFYYWPYMKPDLINKICLKSAIITYISTSIEQIQLFFGQLKLCIAVARHNFKWMKN